MVAQLHARLARDQCGKSPEILLFACDNPAMATSRKSQRKQDAIKNNAGIVAWRMAAKEYLRRGSFIHLPKRGTPEHLLMKRRQRELIPIARQQIRKRQEDELKVIRIARAIRIQKRRETMRTVTPPPLTPEIDTEDEFDVMRTESIDRDKCTSSDDDGHCLALTDSDSDSDWLG